MAEEKPVSKDGKAPKDTPTRSSLQDGGAGQIDVRFTHLNTGRNVKFLTDPSEPFTAVADTAYKKLGEARKDSDHFLCKDGAEITLLRDPIRRVVADECKSADFQIRSATGGAAGRPVP